MHTAIQPRRFMNHLDIIAKFLKENEQFSKVEWDSGGLTVYFKDSHEPFTLTEFTRGSPTRLLLENLEDNIEASVGSSNGRASV